MKLGYRYLIYPMALVLIIAIFTTLLKTYGFEIYYPNSKSIARGFYIDTDKKPRLEVGRIMLFPIPKVIEKMAIERHYIRPNIPFMKPIGALPGDEICLFLDRGLIINNQYIAPVFNIDSLGRELPINEGCYTVKTGQIFILSTHILNSFDSRYFGPINISEIQKELVPIWIF